VTPSITAIYSQGVDVGRKRLASSLQDIAKYLKTDDKLFDCIAADIDEKCGHTLRNKVNSMSGGM
jgi:spermidine synthase